MENDIQASREKQRNNETIAALLEKVGEGDRSALMGLYDRTRRLLFGIVCRILGDKTSAEEALLDVYTRVWTHSASRDPKRLTPMEWLITVARTRAIAWRHWNRQDRSRRKPPAGGADPAMTVAPEQQSVARSALASLVPTQREILDLAFYSGSSCEDIAAQIGKPLGAVKTHARLGLSKLDDLFRPISGTKEKPQ